jgi:hypothetical protein
MLDQIDTGKKIDNCPVSRKLCTTTHASVPILRLDKTVGAGHYKSFMRRHFIRPGIIPRKTTFYIKSIKREEIIEMNIASQQPLLVDVFGLPHVC